MKFLSSIPDLIKELPQLSLYSPNMNSNSMSSSISNSNNIQTTTFTFIQNLMTIISKNNTPVNDKVFFIQILLQFVLKRGELSILLKVILMLSKIENPGIYNFIYCLFIYLYRY